MNTRKLYYENCHQSQFSAKVLACEETEKGFWVTLDATAFYPEGGGQACDLGFLDDAQVLAVKEENYQVLHLCDKPLAVGAEVVGRIDWPRRFDQMQQHTGEHILSGILNRLFGAHNVGFHVGADTVTLDFDIPISPEGLVQAEKEANEAIFRNLPVLCYVPSEEQLKKIKYRSKKQLPWPVRIVEVPSYDTCACCGVHVARTGELGIIKIISCIKFHQGVRVEMVCGQRAFQLLSRIFEENRTVSQEFSAKMLETGEAAKKANEALAKEKFRAAGLERQLFTAIGEGYANKGDVVHFHENLEPASVRALADSIATYCGGTASVFSDNGSGHHMCLVNKGAEVRELGQDLAKNLGGKGGGKNGFFQGSVQATRKEIEAFFSLRG